jgi:hypothetical protein
MDRPMPSSCDDEAQAFMALTIDSGEVRTGSKWPLYKGVPGAAGFLSSAALRGRQQIENHCLLTSSFVLGFFVGSASRVFKSLDGFSVSRVGGDALSVGAIAVLYVCRS